MKISLDRQFETREELDTYVAGTFGENPDKNKALTIEAPQEELTKLMLDDKKTVFGVKVKKKV